MSWTEIPTGLIFCLGGVLALLLPQVPRKLLLLALPLLAAWQLLQVPDGATIEAPLFGVTLQLLRLDGLSAVWAFAFCAAALIGAVYQAHVRNRYEDAALAIYAGAAIGAVLAGDLLTLFVWWEITAVTSVVLVVAPGTETAIRAGMRYLLVQIASGVLLLGGIVVHWRLGDGIAFDALDASTTAGLLILLAFGIKAAFPLLGAWLSDAYPAANPTGTVVLSAFTTKMAIYALARAFPGTEVLIVLGAVMVLASLAYAIMEDDIRRMLAHSLNSQLGFMVVAVGIGTELAISAAAAQAVAHILYKGLMFMVAGAVIVHTGTGQASALGGLARRMPLTFAFCIAGVLAMSSPLFAGYAGKALVTSAADKVHWLLWLVLMAGAAGAFAVPGLKLVHGLFLAKDATPVAEGRPVPANMPVAMVLATLASLAIGLFPDRFYALMPYPVSYDPNTVSHLLSTAVMLAIGAIFYAMLRKTVYWRGADLRPLPESDWFYRHGLQDIWRQVQDWAAETSGALTGGLKRWVLAIIGTAGRLGGPAGLLGKTVTPGAGVFWLTAMLGLYLLIFLA